MTWRWGSLGGHRQLPLSFLTATHLVLSFKLPRPVGTAGARGQQTRMPFTSITMLRPKIEFCQRVSTHLITYLRATMSSHPTLRGRPVVVPYSRPTCAGVWAKTGAAADKI